MVAAACSWPTMSAAFLVDFYLENRMKTKLFVPALLAAAIGCASLSAANATSYQESADTAKTVTVSTSTPENAAYANDVHAQMTTDVRSTGAARGASQNPPAK